MHALYWPMVVFTMNVCYFNNIPRNYGWKQKGLADYSGQTAKLKSSRVESWITYPLPRHLLWEHLVMWRPGCIRDDEESFLVYPSKLKLTPLCCSVITLRPSCRCPKSTSSSYSHHQLAFSQHCLQKTVAKASTPLITLHSCSIPVTCNQFSSL